MTIFEFLNKFKGSIKKVNENEYFVIYLADEERKQQTQT
jgi:hypothetical protein